jgi:hypothetical protein
VLALFLLRTGVHHDAADWLILFGIGLSGLIGQIFSPPRCAMAAYRA